LSTAGHHGDGAGGTGGAAAAASADDQHGRLRDRCVRCGGPRRRAGRVGRGHRRSRTNLAGGSAPSGRILPVVGGTAPDPGESLRARLGADRRAELDSAAYGGACQKWRPGRQIRSVSVIPSTVLAARPSSLPGLGEISYLPTRALLETVVNSGYTGHPWEELARRLVARASPTSRRRSAPATSTGAVAMLGAAVPSGRRCSGHHPRWGIFKT
jgi:hypothetical protein